jgi:lysophospholipase L1-like esterase
MQFMRTKFLRVRRVAEVMIFLASMRTAPTLGSIRFAIACCVALATTILPADDSAKPKSPAIHIALIGDSTVASYEKPPADRPDLTGWGQVFGEYFDDRVEVLNFALSGRSSKSFLAENRWQPVLDAHPDIVFIQFGHNDQPGKGDRSTDPDGDFQDNLARYIDESRAAKAVPVLVTPVARRTFSDGKLTTTLTPYADAMKQVGREKNVPLIDLHDASFGMYERLGDAASADLTASESDRTHFSRKGGLAMARLVARAVPQRVPQLASHLSRAALVAAEGEAEDFPGLVRLTLPRGIPAVVGLETNLYFDNVVLTLNPANYAFDVQCARGRQQQERWAFTPRPEDVGDHPLMLEVRNARNEVVGRARSTVRVVGSEARQGQELSVLMIGDSLTNASIYPKRVFELCAQAGNPRLSLVGSHGPGGMPGDVRHEGYGGWTALRFATHYTGKAREGDYRQRGSPFLYLNSDGKPALDFNAYCKDMNGGKHPDAVTIFLGPNDIFSFDDATIEAGIQSMLTHYDTLIRMIREAAPQTKIGVMLPVPPAASQDAFGANYASGQTRWQYRRNQHRLVERMLEHYGDREAAQIHIVPTPLNLDCVRNYPVESVPPNAQNEAATTRQNNGVHPAASGYRQIGDTVYAWLKGL